MGYSEDRWNKLREMIILRGVILREMKEDHSAAQLADIVRTMNQMDSMIPEKAE
jgi:hypothetical protein